MRFLLSLIIILPLVSCNDGIRGVISVKGNEPHTYTALTAENGELFKVQGPLADELRQKYQGAKVRLRGRIIEKNDKSFSGPGIIEVTEIAEVYKDR
jgi:hypothetical protein